MPCETGIFSYILIYNKKASHNRDASIFNFRNGSSFGLIYFRLLFHKSPIRFPFFSSIAYAFDIGFRFRDFRRHTYLLLSRFRHSVKNSFTRTLGTAHPIDSSTFYFCAGSCFSANLISISGSSLVDPSFLIHPSSLPDFTATLAPLV